MNVSDAVMKTYAYTLIVESAVAPDFIDITRKVEECIRSSGILNGIVVVFSRHTTAAIVIQENEPLLIEDFKGRQPKVIIGTMILMSAPYTCMKTNAQMATHIASI